MRMTRTAWVQNDECLMTNVERNQNDEARMKNVRHSCFVIHSTFEFRHSALQPRRQSPRSFKACPVSFSRTSFKLVTPKFLHSKSSSPVRRISSPIVVTPRRIMHLRARTDRKKTTNRRPSKA